VHRPQERPSPHAPAGRRTDAHPVLAGTFAMLGTLPLVIFTQIGSAVGIGVLLDTIIVRSVLVTALTIDIGRWMWWPSRLARPRAAKHSTAELPATPVH
jgi:putative drug exporter of the RND superfamily